MTFAALLAASVVVLWSWLALVRWLAACWIRAGRR